MVKKRVNLLIVITKLELGGAQKHVLSLLRNLDLQRFNVFLFTEQQGLLINDVLTIPGVIVLRSSFLQRAINPFKDLLAFIALCYVIKKNKITIVHTHSSKAGVLGRLAAKCMGVSRIVHTVHGWSFHQGQSFLGYKFFLMLERMCARLTHQLIVVCRSDQKRGEDLGIFPMERYALIRCALDADFTTKEDNRLRARQDLGLSEDDIVIGMVACFKPQKAPLDFVSLAASLRSTISRIKFVMVGDGVLRHRVMARVRELGLGQDFIFTGWRRDISSLLSALDISVLTSRWEGLPLVVLESLAAGIVVVATDTGGIKDVVISGDNGYLFPRGDITGMRNCIFEMLNNPEMRENVARRAVAIRERKEFSERYVTQMIMNVYENRNFVNA